MKTKILLLTSIVFILFSSCEDVLDRPQLSSANDDTYWVNENNVRLFMNEYYPYLFVGYNTNWGTNYTPMTGYAFSDDVMTAVKQTNFDTSIPSSLGNATPRKKLDIPNELFPLSDRARDGRRSRAWSRRDLDRRFRQWGARARRPSARAAAACT